MTNIKFPQKELLISAFCGGTILSFLELANMCVKHENIFDVYFYIGMFVAGIIGIFGLLLSQTKDIGGAITAGMAAPQILAGLAKTGSTIKVASFSLLSTVYAQNVDSINILTVIENNQDIYEIKVSDGRVIPITDSTVFKLSRNESIMIFSDDVSSDFITFDDVDSNHVTLQINHRKPILQKQGQSFLRGIFAQQYVAKDATKGKIEVTKQWQLH